MPPRGSASRIYILVLTAVVVLVTSGSSPPSLEQGLALLSGDSAADSYIRDGTEVGGVTSVSDIEGTVEELGYASITVRSNDGHLYSIPNRAHLENVVRKKDRFHVSVVGQESDARGREFTPRSVVPCYE